MFEPLLTKVLGRYIGVIGVYTRNKTESPVNTRKMCFRGRPMSNYLAGYRQVIRRDISIAAPFNCLQTPVAIHGIPYQCTVLAIIIIIIITADNRHAPIDPSSFFFFSSILIVQRLPAEKSTFGRIPKRQEFRMGSHQCRSFNFNLTILFNPFYFGSMYCRRVVDRHFNCGWTI